MVLEYLDNFHHDLPDARTPKMLVVIGKSSPTGRTIQVSELFQFAQEYESQHLPQKLPQKHVGKWSSTMQHMGRIGNSPWNSPPEIMEYHGDLS